MNSHHSKKKVKKVSPASCLSASASLKALKNKNQKLHRQALFFQQQRQGFLESEEKYRVLTEKSPNMIFINQRGRVVYANPKCEKVMGYKREEFYASKFNFLALIHPDDIPAVRRNFLKHQKAKEIAPYEYKMITKGGELIHAILTSKLIHYRGATAILGIVTDITKHKKAEEALRESEKRFRSIFESSHDAMMTVEPPSWRFTSANSAMVRMFKAKNEAEFTSYEPWALSPKRQPDGRVSVEKAKEMIKTAMRKGSHFFEWTHKRINGGEFPAEVLLTRVKEEKKTFLQATVRDITERKRAEEELKRSFSLQRATLESTADGILVVDGSTGKITDFNERFLQLWRLTRKILVSRDDEKVLKSVLIQLKDPKGFLNKVRQLYGHPKKDSFDVLEFKDGRIFERYSHPQLIDGKPVGRVWSFRDVTERKRAEEALSQRESYLSAIIENQPGMTWLKDENSRFLAVNRVFAKACGMKIPERVVGKTDLDIWPQDLARKYRVDDKKTMRTGKPFMAEEPIEDKGTRKWYETYKTPVRDAEGNIIGTSGYAQDITERKRAEDSLWEHRHQLLQIIDTVPHMIFAKDARGRFLLVNRATAEAYQKEPKELIGVRRLDIHKNRQEMKEFLKGDREVLASGKPRLVSNEPFTDELGRKHILQTIKIPFKMIGKKGPCILGVSVDVTEQKKVEEFRNDIVRTVSHELRTPLSIEKEGISLLMDEMAGPINVEQKEILGTVMRSIDRLSRMITSLLDISSIETGKIKLLRKMTDLAELVKDAVFEFKTRAGEKGIDLSVKLPGRAVQVLADPDKIMQVLSNLVDNAIKFTPGRGAVEISLAVSKDAVECGVRDNGIGIAPENVDKTFEKFQQFSRKAGPGGKGFGLGLSIARGIIELHGGRIWIKSKLGKGTRAMFSLPLCGPSEPRRIAGGPP